MNILYLDCAMGAAGDMLMAALLELLPDKDTFLRDMNALGLPGIEVTAEPSVKCGVTGTHVHVFVHGEEEGHEHHDHEHEHGHEHHHTGLHEIERRIGQLPVPEAVREDARTVYRSIADAESRVHGAPVDQIHFHEVGTLDALVCNPPYVTSEEMTRLEPSVKEYEPALALDGGKDGLAFYRAVAENFTHLLSDGGYLCFEFGLGQHMAVSMILQEYGYTDIVLRKDLRGVVRAVRGKKK